MILLIIASRMQESQNERFAYSNEIDKARRQKWINALFLLGAIEALGWLILAGFLFVELGVLNQVESCVFSF